MERKSDSVVKVFLGIVTLCFCLVAPAYTSTLSDGSRSYVALSGEWQVQPIEGWTFEFPPPAKGWQTQQVPLRHVPAIKSSRTPYGTRLSEALTDDKSDVRRKTGVAAWFKREFIVPKSIPAGQRALLHLEGISYKSEYWLNGQRVGESILGQIPVTLDVTDQIRPGDHNELVIGLSDREALLDMEHKTFIATTSGVAMGIWGDVKLEFVPTVRVDDVFIKTHVSRKQIELDVTLVNAGSEAATVSMGALIRDVKQDPVTSIDALSVSLAPGETKTVQLTKDWIAPELWSPANPALYFAEVQLQKDGAPLDAKTTRFGFREFDIRGRDFYLNGERIVMLRNSTLYTMSNPRAKVFDEMREMAGRPYNTIRLHLGFNSEAILDLCDELGLMAIPESAWHNTLDTKTPLDKREHWLPNVVEYTRELVKLHRNRPSVVIWTLANESMWDHKTPAHLEVADALVAAAREMDPTRPLAGDGEVNWDGRLDVITIHYPESTIRNALRNEFPNSGTILPNDAHWLRPDEINESWRAKFVWNQPLVIGEYWFPCGNADPYTALMGESVYDWQRWRSERIDGRGTGPSNDNGFIKSQQTLTDAYRMDGVAGVNPWASEGEKVMPRIAVRPLDFFPNFAGGAASPRKFVVFNDTEKRYGHMNLQCQLWVAGDLVWEKVIPAAVDGGQQKEVAVPVECPVVRNQVEAELRIRLRHHKSGGWYQLDRHTETVYIMPPVDLSDLPTSEFALLDQSGGTATALAALGLELKPLSRVSGDDLKDTKVLLVGEDTDSMTYRDVIVDFVHSGGVAIVLRQNDWVPLNSKLPDFDKAHLSTRGWGRSYDHPVTAGMEDAQFSYWRPDHLVSVKTFRKPAAGDFRSIVDCGGRYGMRWSPLLEVPDQKGAFLLSSLKLADRVEVEPAAAHLLSELLRYALTREAEKRAPLRLLDQDHKELRAALDAAGVIYEPGLAAEGPVLIDSSYAPTDDEIGTIRSQLEAGGHVWLHGFTKDTIANVAPLFPFTPVLQAYDATVQSAVRRSKDPLLNNLSSYDFFWTHVDLSARSDYFGKGHPSAQLGGPELHLPYLGAGERLLAPAILVKVPVGEGTLLFDNVLWPGALGAETDRVTRIVSSLAANQGALVVTHSDDAVYDYFSVDLSAHANMGYYDPEADDGVGGWTDQGDNDMRFFLINHVGKAGGLETGMEVEAEEFPTEVTMAGRPFTLLDPRKTSNRSVISLRGRERGAKLPPKAEGIAVDEKADQLWFLHTVGWTPVNPRAIVARYLIHYEDGTEVEFPIHYGQEISEWWAPKPVPAAKVAWTGRNLKQAPVGIYATPWVNPHPEKTIATIDLVGDLVPTQIVLLAITGGIDQNAQNKAPLLGKWGMKAFDGSQVRNGRSNGAPLVVKGKAPTLVERDGKSVLHFENGQRLSGKLAALPDKGGLGNRQPFSLLIEFTPEAGPTGYYMGIFQAAEYGQSGFRLMMNRKLHLGVEAFYGALGLESSGLTSSVPLDLGRSYSVEVRFDGRYLSLLIDGRVDAMTELEVPAAFGGEFLVGDASGTDYHFTGTIGQVSFSGAARDPESK